MKDEAMDCAHAREEFSALLDGELDPETRVVIEAHLSECSSCLRELDGLKRVDLHYRALTPLKAPEDLEARVRSATQRGVRIFPNRRVAPYRVWPLLAAAASLALVVGAIAWNLRRPTAPRFEMAKSAAPVMAESPAQSVQAPQSAPTTMASDVAADKPAAAPPPASPAASSVSRVAANGTDGLRNTAEPAAKHVAEPTKADSTPKDVAPRKDDTTSAKGALEGSVDRDSDAKRESTPSQMRLQPGAAAGQRVEAAPQEPALLSGPALSQKTLESERNAPQRFDGARDSSAASAKRADESPSRSKELVKQAPASMVASGVPQPVTTERLTTAAKPRAAAGAPIDSPKLEFERPSAPENAAPVATAAKSVATPEAKSEAGVTPVDVKNAAERAFRLRDGIWTQDGYKSGVTTLVVVHRGSSEFSRLLKNHPELDAILTVGDRVIARVGDRWYRFEPKVADKP